MEWSAPTLWWLAAGLLVVAELLTGTFYLLMLALGAAAGALAGHAGASAVGQIAVAALMGAGFTAVWHFKRASSPRSAPVERNRDANLDIGTRVDVPAWGSDGSARVSYRGSAWTARLVPGAPAAPGAHVIVAVHGNQLELAPAAPGGGPA